MKCPDCGDKDAVRVPLFTGLTYLCANQCCRFFDFDHAVKLCSRVFGAPWMAHALPNDQGYLYEDPADDSVS